MSAVCEPSLPACPRFVLIHSTAAVLQRASKLIGEAACGQLALSDQIAVASFGSGSMSTK